MKLKRITKSRARDTLPVKAWAEISEDIPPEIWNVSWDRDNLRQDLRHIRVNVIPVGIVPRAAPRRRTAQ